MGALIDKLFPQDQADAIRTLWEDKSSQLLLEQEIGKRLISYDGIIEELPLAQLMLITSLSTFADSPDECYNVASIIYWGINKEDILPRVAECLSNREIAYKCLVSLGFFREALIARWERHAAPSPNFYRKVGINSFNRIGMEDVGSHFYQWESFMGEFFV